MSTQTFLQGIVIGFTLAVAVGPIAILLMQRTLARGWWMGIVSGLGIALADASYGLLGGLGLATINQFLVAQEIPMRIAGGALLIYLGFQIMRSVPDTNEVDSTDNDKASFLGDFSSIYLLTLSNPLTIFSFAAIYTGINLGEMAGTWQGAVYFSLSVFLGSFIWWAILATGVHGMRARFSATALRRLNLISGLLIAAFGGWMIWQVF